MSDSGMSHALCMLPNALLQARALFLSSFIRESSRVSYSDDDSNLWKCDVYLSALDQT